jgi:hypothetical protein
MKINLITIVVIFLILGCSKSEISDPIKGDFIINIEDKEPIQFNNSECEFDNGDTQSQYNITSPPFGYSLTSTFKNIGNNDTITSQIWIKLFNEYKSGQTSFSIEELEKLLESENISENFQNLRIGLQIEICGFRYDGLNRHLNSNIPYNWSNENFKYQIKDFEIKYKSDCIDKDLLYLKLDFHGKLHGQNTTDSLYLNHSEMELLIDLE